MSSIDVKKINDREIWVGKTTISLIEGNIIYVIAEGEQTPEIASLEREACDQLSMLVNGKTSYLINLNKCGKNSPEAREIWQQISERESTYKAATFGINPVARVIASFVIGVYRKNNLRFFSNKEEAMAWLLE